MVLSPTGPGLSLLLVSAILLTFSWVTVIMRMIVRRRIRGVGLDDWFMVAGLIFFTLACQATITGSFYGVGSPDEVITDFYDQKGKMWFMFFQLFYVLSTVPIKASICVAMLRISTSKVIHFILYTVITLSAIAAFVTDVAVLTWCKPVAATWDPSAGTCADTAVITNVSYFISATSILTDWTCAILPAVILWDVHLRFKIKAPVAIVLGFGFVASTATIVRLRYLLAYNEPNENYLRNIAHIAIWSITESGLGIIAGSLATLRPLLKYVPFLSVVSSGPTPKTDGTPYHGQSHQMNSLHYTKKSQQRTVITAGDRDWDRLSDTESQKNIVETHSQAHSPATNEITVTTDVSQQTSSRVEDEPQVEVHDRFDRN